ncbi:MAG: CoA transferase [Dehalococcoidales bacterium]|nr:CoA transferase [Dehalococcoidales bacterium]
MSDQALAGIRVVEWGEFVAAPFCTELLAQMGAEVIKIEPPGAGDEARRYGPFPKDTPHPEKSGLYLYLNVNKLGITLNPTRPRGRELLLQILDKSDVFVVNQPGLNLKKLGLDYESLQKTNPKLGLIMALITPFGTTGLYKDWKGYDINCSALGGITNTIGYPKRSPLTPPLHQGHHQAGLMTAIAIMLAVLNRDLTGKGAFIDQSEAEAWATVHIGIGLQPYVEEGRIRRRSGHLSLHRPYPDGVLPCKDGAVCIDAPQNRMWQRFIEAIGNPDWAKDPIFKDRVKTSDDYYEQADAFMSQWLMKHTKAEIFKLLKDAKVPSAPLRTVDEIASDEQLKQRGFFTGVEHPVAGKLKYYPGACYQFSKTPASVVRSAPLLGEHNEHIFCQWLGYPEKDLAAWRREEVI